MSNCEVFSLPIVEVELHQVREVCRCVLHTVIFNRALGHVRPVDVDSELFDVTYATAGDPGVDEALEARLTDFVAFAERAAAQHAQQRAQRQRQRMQGRQQQQQQHGGSEGGGDGPAGGGGGGGSSGGFGFGGEDEDDGEGPPVVQLRLSFYERRRRQAGGWLGLVVPPSDERLVWEQWRLNLAVASPGPFARDHTALAATDAAAARQARLQAAVEGLVTAVVRHVNDRRRHIPPVVSAAAVTFPFELTWEGGSRSSFGLSAVRKMLSTTPPPSMLGS